jgi:hypothetical protein
MSKEERNVTEGRVDKGQVEKTAVSKDLSPSMQVAIEEAVSKAIVGAIPTIISQLMPKSAPIPEKIFSDQINPTKEAVPYRKVSRGYPVQPGQTWHDLTPEQRKEWMTNHENRWKRNFNTKNTGMEQSMSWTRG